MSPEADAERILAAHKVLCGPPVDVYSIVRARGIIVYPYAFVDSKLSGVFRWVRNVPTIAINGRHWWTRRRFSLAHELYHYLHDMPTPDVAYLMLRRGPKTAGERDANTFAACLLMPSDLVRDLHSKGLSLEAMCATLAVSKEAMRRRFEELHLEG